MWVEYYLYSVVSAEMGSDAPMESLKAQAVAGRSEAAAKITRGIVSSSFFDFYDTAIAQVYRGKGDETKRVRQAVDSTRGEVLVWQGHVVDAVYSNSCGGVIADSHDMWAGENEGTRRRICPTAAWRINGSRSRLPACATPISRISPSGRGVDSAGRTG